MKTNAERCCGKTLLKTSMMKLGCVFQGGGVNYSDHMSHTRFKEIRKAYITSFEDDDLKFAKNDDWYKIENACYRPGQY